MTASDHGAGDDIPREYWWDLTPRQRMQARAIFHPVGGPYSGYVYEIGVNGDVLSRRRPKEQE